MAASEKIPAEVTFTDRTFVMGTSKKSKTEGACPTTGLLAPLSANTSLHTRDNGNRNTGPDTQMNGKLTAAWITACLHQDQRQPASVTSHATVLIRTEYPVVDLTFSNDETPPQSPGSSVDANASQRQPISSPLTLSDDETPPQSPGSSVPAKVSQGQPISSPLARHSVPTSSSPLLLSRPPATWTCYSCWKAIDDARNIIQCANRNCPNGYFCKACAGFAIRPVRVGWRCYQCRAPPSSMQSPSPQLPRHVQLSREPEPPTSPLVWNNTMSTMLHVAQPPEPLLHPEHVAQGEPELPLHPEQEKVVDLIMSGANVFCTGSAGTGKSMVLASFVKKLEGQGKHVDIVAPTGISASHVGGQTLLKFAGWYPDVFKNTMKDLKGKALKANSTYTRLCQTDVLVIDEISMVARDTLQRLDLVMRYVRGSGKWEPENGVHRLSNHDKSLPFGGVQIVVMGDFCQLPPVKPFEYCIRCGGGELPEHAGLKICPQCKDAYWDEDKWAFCSEAWEACGFTSIRLRHIHRQSDKRLIDILEKFRKGAALSEEDKQLLLTPKPDPPGAVRLFPGRKDVRKENQKIFRDLKTPERVYECQDHWQWQNKNEQGLNQKYKRLKDEARPDGPLIELADHRYEQTLRLKQGMPVILLANLSTENGLVNGSQGKVIGFRSLTEEEVWSIVEPWESFADPDPVRSAIIEKQIRGFITRNGAPQWPVVEFLSGHTEIILPSCQPNQVGSERPYSYLSRTQIPLIAGWAITIHKSQGMTLDRVVVDLSHSFEREHAYVALSRARLLEGLKVVALPDYFNHAEAGPNPQVDAFHREHGLD